MLPPTLHISQHPAVLHKLAILRDEKTEPKKFREIVRELSWLLGYEALADARVRSRKVTTPMETMDGHELGERIGRTRASSSASYPRSHDSSRTTSRNFFGSVSSSRRIRSLWRTAGWRETWSVGGVVTGGLRVSRLRGVVGTAASPPGIVHRVALAGPAIGGILGATIRRRRVRPREPACAPA